MRGDAGPASSALGVAGGDLGGLPVIGAGGCVLGGRHAADQAFEVDRGRGEQQLDLYFRGAAAAGTPRTVAFEL